MDSLSAASGPTGCSRRRGRRAAALALCLLLAGPAQASPPWARGDGGDDADRARRELREQLRAERERWREARSDPRAGAPDRPDGRAFEPGSRGGRRSLFSREADDGGRLSADERLELRRQLHEAARARRGDPAERGEPPVAGGGGPPGRPPDAGFAGGWAPRDRGR